jgi:hypothetical protein
MKTIRTLAFLVAIALPLLRAQEEATITVKKVTR